MREKISNREEESQEIAKVVRWMKQRKWCLGLALSGSRAWKWSEGLDAEKIEDFDFLVIVKTDCLWRARAETMLWAWSQGKKRKRNDEGGCNGWCFNLWLDENNLLLPLEKQTWFSLGEMFQLRWLINREQVKERLVRINWQWLRKKEEWIAALGEGMEEETGEGGNSAVIMREKISNRVFFFWQNLYMKRAAKRREVVNLGQAFFHPVERNEAGVVLSIEEKAKRHKIRQKMKDQIKVVEGKEIKRLPPRVAEVVRKARENGQVVVLVTGVFDLLHEGHREFLERAKDCGEVLIVGLESDRRARELKGEDRPTWKETERFLAVTRLGVVDGAMILPDDFDLPEKRKEVLKLIGPDLLAVSPKTLHLLNKKKLMRELGGDLAIIKTTTDGQISTTKKLANQRAVTKSRQKS